MARSLIGWLCTIVLLAVPVAYSGASYAHYWGMSDERLPFAKILAAVAVVLCVAAFAAYRRKPALVGVKAFLGIWCAALLMNLAGNAEVYGFLPQLSMSLLLSMGVLSLAFAALGRWAVVPLSIMVLFESIRSYCLFSLGLPVNAHVLAEIAAASRQEVMGFVTWENILLFLAATAAVLGCLLLLFRALRRESRLALLCTGCLLMAAFVLVRSLVCPSICNRPCGMWPVSAVSSLAGNVAEGYARNMHLVELVQSLPSPAKEPSDISTLRGGEGVVCILHVGESVRADRLSLNGWKNDTTPWLRQQAGLVNFPVCIASAPETMKSFIGIMTNARFNVEAAPRPEYLPTVGSVMDLFAANRFECASFWGTGAFDDQNCTPFTQIIYCLTAKAEDNYQVSGDPMLQVGRILAYCREHAGQNLFILVNNEGSHMPFARYDTENPPFLPTNPKAFYQNPKNNPQKALEANNAYDNTIRYTDDFIRSVVEGLGERPLLYVYVSDHGEYIGQDGMWMRGDVDDTRKYYSTDGCRVPLLFYVSGKLEGMHPHFADAVARMREHASMTVAHEHVFHSLLGFFGISSPCYDASLDLSSPLAKPYTGPQPCNNGEPLEEKWH